MRLVMKQQEILTKNLIIYCLGEFISFLVLSVG